MPRFFFDMNEGSGVVRDDDGLEFPDLEAAERDAIEAAAGMARDRFCDGESDQIVIEVRDESGVQVLRVSVTMHVERVQP